MTIHQSPPSSVLVIFGATGDLAKRKLYPALFKLYQKGHLSENFAVVGVARRQLTVEQFRGSVIESIRQTLNIDVDANMDSFSRHFYYHPFDVDDDSAFSQLKDRLNELDARFNVSGNRIFYLAMAPRFFGTVAVKLKRAGLTNIRGWKRLVIEKPFGHDLRSAQQLNDDILQVFTENEIYRIDHYLGKEMVQNIEVIRFANALFEPLWNNRFISNIQITSNETLGVGDRVNYFEKSGTLRDMVQNHMLQMVSLLAMEPPSRLNTEEIRSEKVKVLRSLRSLPPEEIDHYFVRGQYDEGFVNGERVVGYRDEDRVDPHSNTETFVAGKLMIDNFRWAGVPFYIKTGKRLAKKSTQIVVEFKDIPMNLYFNQSGQKGPNLLIMNIQPNEGMILHLNAKKPGPKGGTTPISLELTHHPVHTMNSRESYESLLLDCMLGDTTNFTSWDEVALSWIYVDPISLFWSNQKSQDFPNYKAGSIGPQSSHDLLAKDGFHWWSLPYNEKP
ncbi:glucose-6-phosphate dehydrogenase [Terrihalobacillus insolitus]|uniref:glucose-6-phosphate dehydrogenase n=1 Tax=Terrihalobacillus insolitus TaxID=2950438 RepID=UPI0023417B62|nr:glucose-6-phosphate dehydrogenase [Terrihalobacillus insolitus]MDC3412954.1 glucose-6-phosphate dehydrogenase [Terrihalobacillus insolitus]